MPARQSSAGTPGSWGRWCGRRSGGGHCPRSPACADPCDGQASGHDMPEVGRVDPGADRLVPLDRHLAIGLGAAHGNVCYLLPGLAVSFDRGTRLTGRGEQWVHPIQNRRISACTGKFGAFPEPCFEARAVRMLAAGRLVFGRTKSDGRGKTGQFPPTLLPEVRAHRHPTPNGFTEWDPRAVPFVASGRGRKQCDQRTNGWPRWQTSG